MPILNLRVLRLGPPAVLFHWVPEKNRELFVSPVTFCTTASSPRAILINHPLRRTSDPLVHHGRHFGRTVHAMCNVPALVTKGIMLMGQDGDMSEESLTTQSVMNSDRFRCLLLATEDFPLMQGEKRILRVSKVIGDGSTF
jgi:hypothetical protein